MVFRVHGLLRLNTVKMATLSKGTFRFNVILSQNVKADPEIHMKLQGTRTSKSILQMKKMQSQRTHTHSF